MQPDRTWYYALQGQKGGPVPEAELIRLRSAGVVNDQSLVWTEGWVEWRPLGQISELQAAPAPTPAPLPPPARPGNTSTDGTAIATLVCGILGLFGLLCCVTAPVPMVAVVLGHLTLGRVDLNSSSRQLATVGLVLGYLGLALLVLPFFAVFFSSFSTGWWEHVPGVLRKFKPGVGI